MDARFPLHSALAFLLVAAAAGTTAVASGATDAALAAMSRAAESYETGRCAEVLDAFEALDEASRAGLDGLAHYRWGFCLGALRRGDPAGHYREAARLLAAAAESSPDLMTHFYLANALLNLGQSDDAAKAARQAVALWKSGRMTIPQDRPNAWFRLGKLFRDAGDPKGALDPFRRALDAEVRHGGTLRTAYLERIADGARQAGDVALAERAQSLLDARRPGDPGNLVRRARTLLAANKLDEAQAAFDTVRRRGGDLGMAAQYASQVIDRIREVRKEGLEPATALADGTPLDAVADLAAALRETAVRANRALSGEAAEKKRKKGKGVRFVPTPAAKNELLLVEAEFVGLLREAVVRGVPLREWAVQGGYAPLIHHRWIRLFRQRAERAAATDEEAQGE